VSLDIRIIFAKLDEGEAMIPVGRMGTGGSTPRAPLPWSGLVRHLASGGPAGIVSALSQKHVWERATVRLSTQQMFSGRAGQVAWNGYQVLDAGVFEAFLSGPTRVRLQDEDLSNSLKEEMRALGSTGMDPEVIESFLVQAPPVLDWEVGEALAECFLAEEPDWQAVWPSNSRRDRRSPRASLPGADLVVYRTRLFGPSISITQPGW
jgi:hypothetical protein